MKISKLDVAKRELEHSIRLFFLSGDPIVIHLVASAAQTILRDLAKEKNIPSFLDKYMEYIKPDKRKFVKGKLSEAHNFMKHADTDANQVFDFNPESSEYVFWESIDLYYMLAREVTGLMQACRLFLYTKYADLLIAESAKKGFIEIGTKIDLNNRAQFIELATEMENKRTK